MIINFSYKGKVVSINTDLKFDLKRVYECSLTKFEHHYSKKLQLLGSNLKFRLQRTNFIIKSEDLIGASLQDNDTIIIEPIETLTGSNPNIHTPRRFDPLKSDNSYSSVPFLSSDHLQMKNHVNSKIKSSSKFPNPVDAVNGERGHRYQKSDQSPAALKGFPNVNSAFDRSDLRRSLGADVAPQFDMSDYSRNRIDHFSITQDSESSISDFSNLQKPLTNKRPVQLRDLQTKFNGFEKNKSVSKSAPASPTKPMPPPRSPHTHMSMLNTFNVRTIGNKIPISIVKKPSIGLGFTIVTRDNEVQYGSAADIANSVVILVNKILPNGGADEDNRLRPGDRLLEVNGLCVSSLKDATEKLRGIPENERVNLLISRVDRSEVPDKEPEPQICTSPLPRKQITFEIPLNHYQKDKQQLGLNIRHFEDKDSPQMGPGIYIHSILTNSLASQQGGLKVDDKLIGINGRSLADVSVEDTIDRLKKVMQNDSVLIVTVFRAVIKDTHGTNTDSRKKDRNHQGSSSKLLSSDRRHQDSLDSRGIVNSSHYSSNESLSHPNSNTQPIESGSAFVRESKGRRSMSDKRKAHEDASQFNFYKETRIGAVTLTDDRLYSTLPTASRLKKMSNSQPQIPTNKTQAPVKPSQIKQLNTPKAAQDPFGKVCKTPNRSISLRSSPITPSQSATEPTQSPRHYSHTPTQDQPPNFNRAMNNSFKRAVQKSLPENGPPSNHIMEKSHSLKKEVESVPKQALIENSYPIYNPRPITDKFARSHSVKDPSEKSRCFNLKNFLTFSSNATRTKSIVTKEKADTFPLNQQPRHNQSSTNNSHKAKQTVHSIVEIPPLKLHHNDDPVIVDSTKRVLEWQMKNEDVILKENKIKEQKIYQTISSQGTTTTKKKKSKPFNMSIFGCCSASGKNKTESNMAARTPVSNRNTFPKTTSNQQTRDNDLYDTIDGTVKLPSTVSKQRASHPKSSRTVISSNVVQTSPKNGVNLHSSRITYQSTNSRKTSPSHDIYATVNKSTKKDPKSSKVSSGASHGHKYRF